MSYSKKLLAHNIVQVEPLPNEQELADYYANAYYQESDGKKSTYDVVYTDKELAYKKLEADLILEGIKDNTNKPFSDLSILDLGCGEGFFVKEAARTGARVKGVDFSSFGVEKWNPEVFDICAFGNVYSHLDQESERYDVCVLRNVLEHVIDPDALLAQIKAVLKDNGLAFVTVPNDYSALQRRASDLKYIDREFWFAPPDHLHYFNTKNIGPYMNENNFDVIDMFSSFPVDFFLYHDGSNYIAHPENGKGAHFARIEIDLLMAEEGMDKLLRLYRSMADCGVGRDFTVVLKPVC